MSSSPTPRSDEDICSMEAFYEVLRQQWDMRPLYRGEAKASYQLKPKFGRMSRTDKDVDTERAVLGAFKRQGTPHLTHAPASDWEWLALGQHFGLATRLLDWTENPLVAAFFATALPATGGDRILYVLDEDLIEDADEDTSPFDIDEVVLYRPKHISPRIASQAGLFTVQPEPREAFVTSALRRLVIKDSCVIDLYLSLKTYGITPSLIFPDLGGVAQAINENWGIL